ncbi:hypothetical protein PC129_g18098 [Phytophthora cactorum]|nr:hypothetical protein PC114_g21144 [Phytophthora cactorum]KAG2966889.1 hypothetical protein PC118_g18898 [Phytophthora cactorum]KAG2983052.1 hypothetical protein PC119_g20677 [Phytophthora cactorum]KAG3210921.1 hypothetical protein PC129_g18098 [Phytophthora cactorum]RAW28697.1 hypothetical protein PC110_g14939 [Phytophthora cactorum]
MAVRRETCAERQAFQDRIAGVHAEDRHRLMKEHRDFVNGTRVEDANFTSARPQSTSIPDPRRPPMGKDAAYSLQLQTTCKKYYRAVFLGLVDMAVVNAYIVYREARTKRRANSITHAEFLTQLQAQILELTEEDFAQSQADAENVLARTLPAEHAPRENPDYQIVNGHRKRR